MMFGVILMSKFIDMTGWKMWEHGVPDSILEVINFSHSSKNNGAMWNCKCQCGNFTVVAGYALRKGRIKSCGCAKNEKTRQRNMKATENIVGYKNDYLEVIEDLGLRPQLSRNKNEKWVLCKCLTCQNLFEVRWNNVKTGVQKSCGCLTSYGEKVIRDILLKNNIYFKQQYTFNDLIGERGNKLRFDFGILDKNNNLIKLIEFDGRQHYTGPEGGWTNANSLEKIQELDERKNQYCCNNHILLQRIPYTDLRKITLKLLLQGIEKYYE